MAIVFCCVKNCFDGMGFSATPAPRRETNPITLDTNHIGHEVVIVKNGLRICGSGGAITNAPQVQSKSYFEVKIQQSGVWGVGLATLNTDLNRSPGGMDAGSWVFCWDGVFRHNNTEIQKALEHANEGDILGVSYDHVELNFYLNGKNMDSPVTGVKGHVFPVLFVDDGAILDIVLDNFNYPPPQGFEKIMLEQSLL
ncbi:LOW QUALITY PROTEIN: SPRY domain-containing protein 7-like [Schistocerca cancellata]|uniref:LOW QUALITY PROTEIN: SPRY domain-containing protein 7-like n=1 Tax=Schistocerca cancellata TaxID=274614 RepID=UPI0021193DEF|nr:LOW QUALITY PROTEIN: SPRY domain-containing protein 7-like [Schistocerca cancellata]